MHAGALVRESGTRLLTFDAASHTYRLGERVLLSVTQVLKSTGVIDHAKIPQDVLLKASHRGRWVHVALQALDDGNAILEGMPQEYQPWLDAYAAFKRDNGFVVLLNEHRSYHKKHLYAGTMDRLGLLRMAAGRDSRWLIDFKTGVYFERAHRLQLAAYAGLLPEPRRYKRGILQLFGNGTYRLHPHSNFDRDFNEFIGLLSQTRKGAV
jgi:hypothetical protein